MELTVRLGNLREVCETFKKSGLVQETSEKIAETFRVILENLQESHWNFKNFKELPRGSRNLEKF